MPSSNSPSRPSLPWRIGSAVTMGLTGLVSKAFLFGFNRTEVQGLEKFVKIWDERKDVESRGRGLLTGPFGIDIVIFTWPNLLCLLA